jgi:hypothetical protein
MRVGRKLLGEIVKINRQWGIFDAEMATKLELNDEEFQRVETLMEWSMS